MRRRWSLPLPILLAAVTAAAAADTRTVRAGERFTVTLAANPTTGYAWSLARAPDPAIVRLVGSALQRTADAAVGAGGNEVWTFDAVAPGSAALDFDYRRPWEKDTPPARTERVEVRVEAGGFADPFAYCAAVGDVDAPDARWTGAAVPAAVASGLTQTMKVPPIDPRSISWRCMDGHVYACTVGANIPCTEKARTDPTPTDGMTTWCRENPDADVIPAYAAGRTSAWEWRCRGGKPETVRRLVQPDARGFDPNVWYRLAAPAS